MNESLHVNIGGLHIETINRQFSDSYDFWDGNWLNVKVECVAPGSKITVQGSILRIDELESWKSECQVLYKSLKGTADLKTLEPNLNVHISAESGGHIKVEVDITPDHLNQKHLISFDLDQSFLPSLINQIDKIIETFPIRK